LGFPAYMRKQIFARDDAHCVDCGDSWYEPNYLMLECHHKKPLSLGGLNTLDNGELLCRYCHLKAHERLFRAAKRRNDKKAMNVNARAIRLMKKTLKQKGLKRYGFE
jgi:5-methylcytosine-specific restriction endonuclease McrA